MKDVAANGRAQTLEQAREDIHDIQQTARENGCAVRPVWPMIILRMEGKEPADWPRPEGGAWMGPYCIGYENFKPRPAEAVAGLAETPRIPYGVVRLRLARAAPPVPRATALAPVQAQDLRPPAPRR